MSNIDTSDLSISQPIQIHGGNDDNDCAFFYSEARNVSLTWCLLILIMSTLPVFLREITWKSRMY